MSATEEQSVQAKRSPSTLVASPSGAHRDAARPLSVPPAPTSAAVPVSRPVDSAPDTDPSAFVAPDERAAYEARIAELEAKVAELESNKRRFETILESLPSAVMVSAAPTGHVVFANRRVSEIMGEPYETSGGFVRYAGRVEREDGTAIAPEDYALVRATRRGEHVLGERIWFRRASGERVPLSVTAAPIVEDGKIVGGVTTFADVSWEEETVVLSRRARAMEEESRRYEEANRLKSSFLANISHELRTPLNAILGFTELIHDGRVGAVSELQKEYLGDVLSSARHLLGVINDVLDLSKVEAGKMVFRAESVDVGELVIQVRDGLRPMATAARLVVVVDVEPNLPRAEVDPGRLRQIVYNYVSNALKFTPKDGSVSVRVRRTTKDTFRIEVVDTGPGIAPTDLPLLFSEFRQLETSASSTHKGTGLGLALSKKLADAQGGSVGVSSEVGVGSTFWVDLPLRAKEVT